MRDNTNSRAVSRVPTQWLGSNFVVQVSTAIVAICGGFIGLNLKFEDLDQPWKVGDSDLSGIYAIADAVRTPFHYVSSEYGFPNGANFGTQVVPEDMSYLGLGFMRWVTGDPVLAANTFILLNFALTALATSWLFTNLRVRQVISVPLSLATAWAPYVFVRVLYGHIFLANIWVIPVFFYLLLNIQIENSKISQTKRFTFGLLVGSSCAYYGFFSFLIANFLLACTLVTSLYTKQRVDVRQFSKMFLGNSAFVVPTLLHIMLDRVRSDVIPIERGVTESLQFAGDLRNIFVPFGFPQVFSDLLTLRQEYEWSPVALLTVIGIILTLLVLPSGDDCLGLLGTSLILAILFFTSGGLGLIFADLVLPGFRAWARMMPFILVAAHIGLGLILQKFLSRSSLRATPPIIFAFLAFLAGIQVRDARSGISPKISETSSPQELGAYLDTLDAIRDEFQPECGILQIPLMKALEGGNVGDVRNGDQYWPGILSDNFRWSYGAIKGTPGGEYWFQGALGDILALKENDAQQLCVVWDSNSSFNLLEDKNDPVVFGQFGRNVLWSRHH